jgi:hypothetical protein
MAKYVIRSSQPFNIRNATDAVSAQVRLAGLLDNRGVLVTYVPAEEIWVSLTLHPKL